MDWIVFSYSLPTKQGSSSRVTLWRRLRRLGAISVAGGAYVLPAREECLEAFQWLAQEIRSANGEALVIRVERFEGLSDQQLVHLFCAARAEDYAEIDTRIDELSKASPIAKPEDLPHLLVALAKLRRRHVEIAHVDYFNCPEGKQVAQRLEALVQRYSPAMPSAIPIQKADIEQYREKAWVTRPHPYIDRLASIWLIRHFINPQASIRYSLQPKDEEVAFDMNQDEFGHRGNLCTFETMKIAFGLNHPGLRPIAEIVHEIDLQDGRYAWFEIAGIERILNGWTASDLSEPEIESRGVVLFDGLYAAFSQESEAKKQSKEGLSDSSTV